AVLDAAASPGAQVAVLHGTADGGAASSSGLAAVDPSGRLVVAVRELSQTSGAQVYEAWLIGADGKPVPAGSFAVGATGVGTMSVAVAGAGSHVVVALTREPGPGATAPTLPIVLQGTAGAAG
ncbi:MAG TPA: anti-sigma factor, partial [Candidatus Limnocylindrales bacterium]